jgi:hypothetical protein
MGDRSRSRSPGPRDNGDRDRPRKTGGFRWKDKSRTDDSRGDDRRLERGYRDRPRSPRRDRESDRYGDRSRDDRGDRRRDDRDAPREDREKKVKKERKEKKPVVPQSSEPMIVVHVNDRLGTKAAIPCLASDPISRYLLFCLHQPILTPPQSYSRPKWLLALVVNLMRFFSNARVNVRSRTNLHWRTTA